MTKIGDLAADEDTGELVLLTNGLGDDHDYQPYEGLVFEMADGVMTGWHLRKVIGRRLRHATDVEKANLMPQYRARLAWIQKGCRGKPPSELEG